MAIIYSYPTVVPTTSDLILGTDTSTTNQATKNFTVQSILDLFTVVGNDLQAVLDFGNVATGRDIILGSEAAPDRTIHAGTFTTGPGSAVIVGAVGIGFTDFTSTRITGALISTGAAAQIASGVQAVTQAPNDNSTKIATTAYVDGIVDPSILTFAGTTGGDQTVNLVTEKLSLLGTANQIESVSTGQSITFNFPTAGVTLPDGSLATTQALTDTTTKVATTAFVHGKNDAQDLDFSGTAGTGSVLLNSQSLAVTGTALQITTAAAAQGLSIALTPSITISGTYTGTTFAGDLNGTINTATIGTTQAANNDSTLIATTKYVDNASSAQTLDYAGDATGPFSLNLSTDDLEFNGDSNITVTAATVATNKGIVTIDLNNDVTITGVMQAGTLSDGTFSGSAGTYTGGVSITSDLFVGPLTGNATTATSLATAGAITLLGDTTGGPNTYTSGGAVNVTTAIADSVVYNKTLAGFNATTGSVQDGDSIIEALERLQGQITTLPQGLVYQGVWEAGTAGVTDATISGTTITLNTAPTQTVVVGMTVTAPGISSAITVTGVTSQTNIQVSASVALGSGITVTFSRAGGYPDLTVAGTKVNGHFYIVSVAGAATPNSPTLVPNEWDVRDWCVFADDGAGSGVDEWQKVDNSSLAGGSGTANTITKWTNNQTIGNSTITDDGSTVTIANTVDFIVQGNATLGNAASDTVLVKGPLTSESLATLSAGLNLTGGIDVGGTYNYGTAGQVLTNQAGTPSATQNLIWTTPTTGEVESISGLYGITVAGTTAIPTIAITADASNLIKLATTKATPVGADTILINDSENSDVLKQATLTSLKTFTAESWILSDGTNTTTITDGDTAAFAGASGITVLENAGTVTITGSAQPGTGTQFTLPVWDTTSSLGDSMVKQNAATGTMLTIESVTPSVFITDSTAASLYLQINCASGNSIYRARGGAATFGQHIFRQYDGTTDRPTMILNTAGNVDLNGSINSSTAINTSGAVTATSSSSGDYVRMYGSAGTGKWDIYGSGNNLRISENTAGGTGILAVDRGATFGGNVTVTGAVTATVAGTAGIFNSGATNVVASFTSTDGIGVIKCADSSGNVEFGASGNCFVVQPAGGTTELTVCAGSSTFAGDLTVDGNIIHGGTGNGGTYNFSDTVDASSNEDIFSIQCSNGAQAFTVYFTCNMGGMSVAKVYTVVHSYGATVVYNKLVDSGPYSGEDFTPTFTGATDTVTCNISNLSTSRNAEIVTTVMLGGSPTALTVTAL